MKKQIIPSFILTSLFLMVFIVKIAAQQTDSPQFTRKIKLIAVNFGVKEQRAIEIQKVLEFNQDRINSISKDPTIQTIDKQQKINILEEQRSTIIRLLLTVDEQQKFKLLQGQLLARMEIQKRRIQGHNKEQMERHIRGINVKDTTDQPSGQNVKHNHN